MFETRDADKYAVQKFYGKYPGVVKKNAAPKNGNHRGELAVEVSGVLEDGSSENEQRSIVVTAKPCFLPGFFFIPEVGAHVWVEFAAGDINEPIWTGVWYPEDQLPKTADDKVSDAKKKIISTKSGHVIQLDDSDKEETIIIADKTHSNAIRLDKDGITITCTKVKIDGDLDVNGVLTVGTGPKTIINKNEITGA